MKGRREFLIQCGAAAVAFSPGNLRGAASSGADAEFHLHPQYREHAPLDAMLVKRTAGLDGFVTETHHDRIAAILAEWTAGLLQTPYQTRAFETVLSTTFKGCSMRPVATTLSRQSSSLQVHRLVFPTDLPLTSKAFPDELKAYLADYAQILTVEFQVTMIDAVSESNLRTQIRYELVGTGKGFHREQRVGYVELQWVAVPASGYRLQTWRMADETRSRSASPLYVDVTDHALGSNPSYKSQLIPGVDYWRTVLDGACRIDLYGHNGVSVGDIDGDGFDDFYVCQPAGLPNRLFRNRGDGTFEDITEAAGVGVLENTACALLADFDNDGRQDLVVVRADGPVLFLNNGGGKFQLKPEAFQFANAPQGTFTGAAAVDYNRDGLLDIYFCLYVYYQGTDQYKYPTPYHDANNGPPNFLMRNNGDGTFRDVTAECGLSQNNTRFSFCCGWSDCDGDGWPDLYVVNDFGRKNLYRNNGDGTFTDVAREVAVEDVGAGMSVCSLDYDNDGFEDLYVADMWTAAGERISAQDTFRPGSSSRVRDMYRKHAMGNSLFRNKGTVAFEDKTANAGVGMGRWSWSSDAWDFDHDGFSDLYVTNGMVSGPLREDLNSFFWRQVVANSPDEAKPSSKYEQGWTAINELIRSDYSWSGYERNVFYVNNHDGTFSDVSGAVGLDFIEDGRAFALADFNHDGRLEVLLKSRNSPQLRLLKNTAADLPPSICFRLRGTKSNRDAIGAAITLETNIGRQTRMLQAGSGFLSQHGKDVFFGLGESKGLVKASIRWPSGLMQTVEGLAPNHRIFVEEGIAESRAEPFRRPSEALAVPLPQPTETIPATIETWLLVPVAAPDFSQPTPGGTSMTLSAYRGNPVLLHFSTNESAVCKQYLTVLSERRKTWTSQGLQLFPVSFDRTRASDDVAAIYNILYRSLFDRHRDISLPMSFLIDERGDIVKIYQGVVNPDRIQHDFRDIPNSPPGRLSKALPFPLNASGFSFGRNYLSLGSIYFQRGYYDQAAASFQRALSDDASNAEALYGLGSVYLKQDKSGEARTSFERAVALTSSYPDTKPNAWNNLGLLATREGRTDAAISYFQEALRISPDHLISLQNLGNAYRQRKRWDDARATLEKALDVGPNEPEVNYSLAMVFAQTDDSDHAYKYFQRALQLRPDYPEAMNNMGVLYLRTRRRDEAVAEFQECIRVAPAFDQSYLNLARVYGIENDRDKARAVLLALLKQHPDHAQAQKALAELQ